MRIFLTRSFVGLLVLQLSGVTELHAVCRSNVRISVPRREFFRSQALVQPAEAGAYYSLRDNSFLMREAGGLSRRTRLTLVTVGVIGLAVLQGSKEALLLGLPFLATLGDPPEKSFSSLEEDHERVYQAWDNLRPRLLEISPSAPGVSDLQQALLTIEQGHVPDWTPLLPHFSTELLDLLIRWSFVFTNYGDSPYFSEAVLQMFIGAQKAARETLTPPVVTPPVAEIKPPAKMPRHKPVIKREAVDDVDRPWVNPQPSVSFQQNQARMLKLRSPKESLPVAVPKTQNALDVLSTLSEKELKDYKTADLPKLEQWLRVLSDLKKDPVPVMVQHELDALNDFIHVSSRNRTPFRAHLRAMVDAYKHVRDREPFLQIVAVRVEATEKAIRQKRSEGSGTMLYSFPVFSPELFKRVIQTFRDLPQLLKGDPQVHDFLKPYRPRMWKAFAMGLAMSIIATVSPFIALGLYDTAELGYRTQGTFLAMVLYSFFLLAFVTANWLDLYIDYVIEIMGLDLDKEVTHYLTQNLPPPDQIHKPAELANHIFSDPTFLATKNIDLPILLPRWVLHITANAALLWWLDPQMFLLSMVFIALVVFISWRYSGRINQLARAIHESSALTKSELEAAFQVDAKDTTRTGRLRSALIRRFNQSTRDLTTLEIERARQSALFAAQLDTLTDIGMYVLVSLFGVWRLYLYGVPTIGTVVAVSAFAVNLKDGVVNIFELFEELLESMGGSAYILKHWPELSRKSKSDDAPPPDDFPPTGTPSSETSGRDRSALIHSNALKFSA